MKQLRPLHSLLLAAILVSAQFSAARADDTPTPDLVVIPGTLQSKLGCSGDWQPDCESTALIYVADKKVWEATFNLPAGAYEYKVALNGTWGENYGLDAQRDGPNIPLVLAADTAVTFTYNHTTHAISDSVNAAGGPPVEAPPPSLVVIPGTLQSELGCPGDWQPDCETTALTYDEEDGVWQGVFTVQPDSDQDKQGPRYKVALNGGWSANYGLNARSGGADIPLVVSEPTQVKFYFDHKSHWVTDSVNSVIAVAMGTFQSEIGCASDDDPGCLRSWLQDPEGTGVYTLTLEGLPAGTYEVRVAVGETLDEVYGQDGALGGAPMSFTTKDGDEVYMGYDPATHALSVSTDGAPKGDLGNAKAHWISQDTIAWKTPRPEDGTTHRLYYAPEGGLTITPGGIEGGEYIQLKFSLGGLAYADVLKRPHIKDFAPLKIDPADFDKVPEILRGQVAIAAVDADGKVLDATSLQIPGVLDDLFAYDGPLGMTFDGDVPTLRVWAPTAQSVGLHLFADSHTEEFEAVPMTFDSATGVWSVIGDAGWKRQFYLYKVSVYVPSTGEVETNLVTDPYSFSLSMNSTRSQIVNLDDPALMPEGWGSTAKPPLAAPEDIVLYELHVRDFSVYDTSVPEELRGTYRAFTVADSNGMQHLRALAEAGLTHVHLLPAFDIASVDEDKSTWRAPDEAALAVLPPNSEEQQLALSPLRENDGFNWGYDPFHYTTPEGSYSSDPDGPGRIREFREMVQALNALGLRVVMDVVYNHTNASGQGEKSVLDRIVPGYYHRLSPNGQVETSTCCQNTATEHAMMEKLMIDSVVTWATAYKVDGFRFDLMGHHMLSNMQNVRSALDALTPAVHGVHGAGVYVYGEGWNFGEVADGKRGVNATQLNLGGTGIGSFNDRLRDAARGGGPFNDPREQGFITGLFTDPSGHEQGSPDDQRAKLLRYTDWIRVGLAGNLRDVTFTDANGSTVTGEDVSYNGSPAGYTLDPQENIVYVSAHDNETLFDAIQWKASVSATVADRVRMQNLGLSLVLMSQGVPFFHAGDDLLRSKSLDGNSYNSGDWFNRLDFTAQTNNWGVGLPPFGNNRWDLMSERLGNPDLKPGPEDIQAASAHFREMLQVRKSSPLFRMQTAEDVMARLTFLNTGPDQIPGLIVMRLTDTAPGDLDSNFEEIVVVFNAAPGEVTFADGALRGMPLELHPALLNSADSAVKTSAFDLTSGTLTVPGRTTAVFVLRQIEPEPTVTPRVTAVVWPTAEPTPTPTSEQPSTPFPVWPVIVAAIALAGLVVWLRRR